MTNRIFDSDFEIADHDTGDSEEDDDSGADFGLDAEGLMNLTQRNLVSLTQTIREKLTTDPEQAEDSGEEPQKPDDDLGQPEDAAEEDTGADVSPMRYRGLIRRFHRNRKGEKKAQNHLELEIRIALYPAVFGTPYSFDDEDDEDDPIEELSELMEKPLTNWTYWIVRKEKRKQGQKEI